MSITVKKWKRKSRRRKSRNTKRNHKSRSRRIRKKYFRKKGGILSGMIRSHGKGFTVHAIYGQSLIDEKMKGYNFALAETLKKYIDDQSKSLHVVILLGQSTEKAGMRRGLSGEIYKSESYYYTFEGFPLCIYKVNSNLILCELCEHIKFRPGGNMGCKQSSNTFENMLELAICVAFLNMNMVSMKTGEKIKFDDIYHWAGCGLPQILRTIQSFIYTTEGTMKAFFAKILEWQQDHPVPDMGGIPEQEYSNYAEILIKKEDTKNYIDNWIKTKISAIQDEQNKNLSQFVIGSEPAEQELKENITEYFFYAKEKCKESMDSMIDWMEKFSNWETSKDKTKFKSFNVEDQGDKYTTKLNMEWKFVLNWGAGFNKVDIKTDSEEFLTCRKQRKH